jgi:hypothetical protein
MPSGTCTLKLSVLLLLEKNPNDPPQNDVSQA